jgi:hypothetical protein
VLSSGCGLPLRPPYPFTRALGAKTNGRKWRNPNRFTDCLNFEQSLLKLMTT